MNFKNKESLYLVIMAGGTGTRFWPLSRRNRPKQLLPVGSDSPLIVQTLDRFKGIIDGKNIVVVTNEAIADAIDGILPERWKGINFILEPCGRNTAPCIAAAAAWIKNRDPEGLMMVMPSDHLIADEKAYISALEAAVEYASSNAVLATLGIFPTHPETGYGYIKMQQQLNESHGNVVNKVERFVEKPDIENATRFLAEGGYVWNAGMFIWKNSEILSSIERFMPEMARLTSKLADDMKNGDEKKAIGSFYNDVQSESIDFGVMEKADNVVVVPASIGWNDVGSWLSMEKVYRNEQDNYLESSTCINIEGSKGNIVHAPGRTVALVGVTDLVTVVTDDAILICSKDKTQHVKKLQDEFKNKGLDSIY